MSAVQAMVGRQGSALSSGPGDSAARACAPGWRQPLQRCERGELFSEPVRLSCR